MKLKLMDGKGLAKLIGSIGTARVQLDEQVQVACVQVIGQSVVHSNTTPATSLLDAVSKHHKATVVAYLEKFGNFAWDKKAEKLAFRPVHEAGQESFEKVLAMIGDAKWYDAKKPPKVVSQYDAMGMIGDLMERIAKLAKKDGITVVNQPIFTAVNAAYCAAVAKAYEDGDRSAEQQAIDTALKSRSLGQATPAQLKMLSEHFGRPVEQVKDKPSAREAAVLAEAKQAAASEQFGGEPTLAAVNE